MIHSGFRVAQLAPQLGEVLLLGLQPEDSKFDAGLWDCLSEALP